MEKIEEKELQELQKLNTEFNQLKTQLGDVSLQKHALCLRVDSLKQEFVKLENSLMDKYGQDAVINLETGEVKQKEIKLDGEDK